MKRKRFNHFVFVAIILVSKFSFAVDTPAPPKLRLGNEVRPKRISAELTIVPAKDDFSGTVNIDLEFQKPTSVFWLNAKQITIQKATLVSGTQSISPELISSDKEFVGFRTTKALDPGPATLQINYAGKLNSKDFVGLFKQKEGDDWYVFTDFEPSDARRLFPCFDEPAFKIPWQLTLHIPENDFAVANTPIAKEEKTDNGMKRIVFTETKPLPAYLVALAVGPFDVADAGSAGRNHTPLRIITPKGKAAQARYAAEITPQILVLLENYFDIAYPYEKLDQIAVPDFGGAMENAGLITFYMQGLLASPEEENVRWKRRYAIFAAHEIAHQWFGDLVTMQWFDDIWLNEAFASWMEVKITDQWKPDWDFDVDYVEARATAMESDRMITARKIRQPIVSEHDIINAFDRITYDKGESVIEMFETWSGPEKFQKAVHRFLTEHAWGNATAQDFLNALSAEIGSQAKPAFSSFLDQAGVPLLTVELECASTPAVKLRQSRYLPIGSHGRTQQLWQIPLCVSYESSDGRNRTCAMLNQAEMTLELDGAKTCPSWVLANEGGTGYYHVSYQGELVRRLLQDGGKQLSIPERMALIDDIDALLQNGSMPASTGFDLLIRSLQDPNPHVYSATIDAIEGMKKALVTDDLREAYGRFIRKIYGPKAKELTWKGKPGEDDQIKLLRPELLPLAADDGADSELASQAVEAAKKWLHDRSVIDPEMVRSVLITAAQHGAEELWNQFHDLAKKTENRREKDNLILALGAFRDRALVEKSFSIVLSDEFPANESIDILFQGSEDPRTHDLAYEFLKKNFDVLAKRLPETYLRFTPFIGAGFCDEKHKADLNTFLSNRVNQFTGAPRRLQQVVEGIDLCIALRKAQQPGFAEFLQNY